MDVFHPVRALRRGMGNWAWAFRYQLYLVRRRPRDLERALGSLQRALRLTPFRHPMRGKYLTNLGLFHDFIFNESGDPAHLDESVRLLRAALTVTPPGHFRRAWSLANLANQLAEHGAGAADRDEAIRLLRQAASTTRVDDPDRPVIISNLAGALRARGEATGSVVDLDAAVRTMLAASALVTPDHPDYRMLQSNLYGAAKALRELSGEQPVPAEAPLALEGPPREELADLVAAFAAEAETGARAEAVERLRRFAGGDARAVTEVEAIDLAARLWSDDDAHGVGLLAWCRFLVEDYPFTTEDLGLALSRLPSNARPALVRELFAIDLDDEVEPPVEGAPCHPVRLAAMADRMAARLPVDGSALTVQGLRQALALSALAVDLTRPDGELIDVVLDAHADAILRLSGAADDSGLLADVVLVRRLCVETARPGEARARDHLHTLGLALAMAYAHRPDPALLTEARDALVRTDAIRSDDIRSDAAATISPEADLSALFRTYLLVAGARGATDHSHLAWARAARALDELAGEEEFIEVALTAPYRKDDPADFMAVDLFEWEIADIEKGLKDYSRDLGERATVGADLADVYRRQYKARRDRADLDHAITLSELAVEHCPADHPRRRHCLWTRVLCLDARFITDQNPVDLDPLIDLLRELLPLPGPPDRLPMERIALASYLIGRRHPPDLREAEEILTRVAGETSEGSTEWLHALAMLGTLAMARLGEGEYADIDAGIDLLRKAAALPEAHENHAMVMRNLTTALLARYTADLAAADVDEAIAWGRAGVQTAYTHKRWDRLGPVAEILVTGLLLRYRARGAQSDLQEAVHRARGAVEALPGAHPDYAKARSLLAEALAERAARTRSEADLDEAIRRAREAADADPTRRRTLAAVLATPLGAAADRARLLEARQLALDLYRDDPDERLTLAAILRECHRTTAPPDLSMSHEAERLYREALAAAPATAELRSALASVLMERGDRAVLRDAAVLFRAAASDDTGPPVVRVEAARRQGGALAELGDWDAAARAFGTAVELLPLMAPRTLARADREHLLGRVGGLASEAAGAAVEAGDPGRAIRLFEAARGVLWGQLLETRDDLTGLNPDLTDRVQRARTGLDAVAGPARAWHVPYAWEDKYIATPAHEDAGQAWSDLVAEVRAVPGFERFAAPAEGGGLHPGVPGPVVLLAVGHALVLHPGDRIDVVRLPGVTAESAQAQTDRLHAALEAIQDPGGRLAARRRGETEIADLLDWLGDHVTLPVLDALGNLPRLWWLPAGPLAGLPLHAAGGALDRATSSYALSLHSLRMANTVPALPENPNVLLVAMPEILPGVTAETAWLRERFATTELVGKAATRSAVLAALPGADIAHFACHSTSGRDAHMVLAEPLTLLDVAGSRLPRARLACLSSCSTALTDLPDEAVHLAGAFHHAGYAGVAAALWPLADFAAPVVTSALYRTPADPAEALRSGARELAADHQANPSIWACNVHIGV